MIRMLSRDGHPTPLGEAIAHYGRIHKTLHALRLVDDTGYRRDSKPRPTSRKAATPWRGGSFTASAANCDSATTRACKTSSAPSANILNALVLFNTRYLDAAITELRAGGYEVRDEDAAWLSPFVWHHVKVLGRYSFLAPELPPRDAGSTTSSPVELDRGATTLASNAEGF